MRAHLLLVAAATACSLGVRSAAEEKQKLTTDEIQKAFAGNTVHGMWGQTEYYSRSLLLPK